MTWPRAFVAAVFAAAAGCTGEPGDAIDFGLGDSAPFGTDGSSSGSSGLDSGGSSDAVGDTTVGEADGSGGASDGGADGDDATGSPGSGAVAANRITMASERACAIVQGTPWCWGNNEHGQAGNGTLDPTLSPVAVVGLDEPAIAIHAGSHHTCTLSEGGAVHCWGGNWNGQLGNGTAADSVSPVAVQGLDSGVVDLSVGGSHNCAHLVDGSVRCWGFGHKGQVGNGGFGNSSSPFTVDLEAPATTVGTGVNHTCAVLVDDALWCWGDNDFGQLGDGGMLYDNYPTPLAADGDPSVPGSDLTMGGVVAMTGGLIHSCAIVDSGGIKCWGSGFSVAGAVDVPGLSADVEQLAAGSFHTCFALADGTAWCEGRNVEGQLGAGTVAELDGVVQVSTLTDVIDVAAGQYSSCAETSSAIYCWGDNDDGQLGDGTTTRRSSPVEVMSW